MVGPVPDGERRVLTRRLLAGFVLLVGLSAALMAVRGGATPVEAGIAGAAGLATGVVLLVAVGVRP